MLKKTTNEFSTAKNVVRRLFIRNEKLKKRLQFTKVYAIFITIFTGFLLISYFNCYLEVNTVENDLEKLQSEYNELSDNYDLISKRYKSIIKDSNNEEINIDRVINMTKFMDIPLDDELKEYIYTSAVNSNIPPELIFSMAWKESSYNVNATSESDDHGLFQINRCNFDRLSEKFGYSYDEFCEIIYDPYVNTDCALFILNEYKDKYNNDNWHHVLMRYNMGPSGAQKHFDNGTYSSKYSRSILNYANENFNLEDISF